MVAVLAITGAVVGVILRTLLPYLRRKDKAEAWEKDYTVTAVLSLVGGAAITTQTVIAELPPGADFLAGLIMGLGLNTVVNETAKRA